MYHPDKKIYIDYMEFANSSKEAKEKAKIKTKNIVISARVMK